MANQFTFPLVHSHEMFKKCHFFSNWRRLNRFCLICKKIKYFTSKICWIFLGLIFESFDYFEIYWVKKKWGREKVFISSRWRHLWVGLSIYLSIESNLATFTKMLITWEPFELERNVRPFWNPEKECHTKITITSS